MYKGDYFKNLGQSVKVVILDEHFEIVGFGRDMITAELAVMETVHPTSNYGDFKPVFDKVVANGELHVFTRELPNNSNPL